MTRRLEPTTERHELADVVAEILGLQDVTHTHARLRGVDTLLFYRLDPVEDQRRRAHSLTALPRIDWLHLLMDLPAGLPIPHQSLTPSQRRTLRRLPAGCIDHTPNGIVRLLTRPLQVEIAVVTGRQWKPGLVRAGMFAPYCRRALALTGPPRDRTQAAIEADFWDIGLIIGTDHRPHLAMPPAPFIQRRHTAAGWTFLEEVYQAHRG